ncbi:MAG: spermidine synthase [Verrucomicrobia bacterium]|nr:MAG: spermidine synthase [Verrucomicrobiota bacterium]
MLDGRLHRPPHLYATVRVAILAGILFLSGIGSLIFETLWLRLSGLSFGNSVWAAALILSSFMAGLALGNAIAASSRFRRWRPLHLYAVLELAVAFFGCTIVFGLPLLGELMRPVWQMLWNYQPTLIGLRFVLSFLILLIPTTAMGLTLPVLVEDPILRRANFGRAIGFLYGSNTLGAVAGAVVGEAYFIEAFGLHGTGLAAGLASCIAAAIALLVSKRDGDTAALIPERAVPLRLDVSYRPPWRLLFVSFGTGAIVLCLEVVWFRFLRLYVPSSSTAFAVMLAVVLAGIGLGSIVAGAIHRRSARLNQLLPVLLLLAAIATLSSYLFFPGEVVQTRAGVFDVSWQQIGFLSIALIFPVAFLSGILFPSIVACVQASVEDRMNSTGITTLFNTTGAAAGPLLASFMLLPSIGYQWSLILCAAGYALLAILVCEHSTWSLRRPIGLVTTGLCAALILFFAIFPHHRAEMHFAHASRPYETDDQGRLFAHVVKKVEGASDTLQLLRRDLFGEPYYYRLLTNAFSMSATNPRSQRYMRLFAYLPLAFRPESEDVLLICYGCGVTADAFLRGLHVKRMDVVEISKEVLQLADFYSGINYSNPLRDPRVTTFIQDGRFFLQASPRQYDIISGEPPPPKVAGAVNLYTEEFFSLMNSRLKQGGIVTFWLPINQLKVEEAKAILRAFHNVFANASLWASGDQEWIMMGIKGPGRKVEEEELRQLWSNPDTGADLRGIGVEVPQQLGALFVMDGEEIDRITQGVAPLTDIYPKRLTDEPWDDEANHRFALIYLEAPSAVQRFLRSPLISAIWPETLNKSLESFFIVRQTRYLSETIGSNKLAELDLYLRHSHLRMPVLEVLGSDRFRLAIAERVAKESQTPPLETMPDLIAGALARRDIEGAIRLLESEKDRAVFSLNDTFLLIYLYCLNGSVEKAEALAAAQASSVQKDWFVDWLWGKLKNDFGFHPPR